MKCLSIKQPWAAAIVHGPKRIENRSWSTTYRGPLALHAGKAVDLMVPSVTDYIRAGWPEFPKTCITVSNPIFGFGAFVGTCSLVDCVRWTDAQRRYPDQLHWIDECGTWCFVLADVAPLKRPVHWRGMQGLWYEPSISQIIKEAM